MNEQSYDGLLILSPNCYGYFDTENNFKLPVIVLNK